MKQRLLYAALAMMAFSAPATAEPLRLAQATGPGALPPYEILTMLRSTGLDPLDQPVRRGPNYVLRAIDGSDREVRVVVDARTGDVRSVTPVQTASRMPPGPLPRGGVTMGPYERMPPGYIPPDAYRPGPPVAEEDDEGPPPRSYGTQPPAPIPGVPPRGAGNGAAPPVIGSTRPGDDDDDASPPSDPHVITADPERGGMLPPPPERFPQRAAPVAPPKPKPVKRAAAAQPQAAPLPKPKPGGNAAPPQAQAPQIAPSAPSPDKTPAPEETPN